MVFLLGEERTEGWERYIKLKSKITSQSYSCFKRKTNKEKIYYSICFSLQMPKWKSTVRQSTDLIIATQKRKVYIFRVLYLSSTSVSSKLLLTSSSVNWCQKALKTLEVYSSMEHLNEVPMKAWQGILELWKQERHNGRCVLGRSMLERAGVQCVFTGTNFNWVLPVPLITMSH